MTTQDSPRIDPVQLTGESRFKFICDKNSPCFTSCCRGIDIALTPYDIIRLKKRLDLPSDQFLAIYTKLELLLNTNLPVPTLKLLDDEKKSCPFVRDDGCLIYTDRPAACRYYPVGHGTLRPKEADATELFYFLVKEPHCLGFESEKEWTVDEWRRDQGVDEYDEQNSPWTEVMVRKRSFPPNMKLTEKAKKLFFMASYDLDNFRRFVFESSFFSLYPVDQATKERIKDDDVALLHLGANWLIGVLFGRGELAPEKENVEKRIKARTQQQDKQNG